MLFLLVLPFAVQAQRVSVDIEGLGSDSLKVDIYPWSDDDQETRYMAVWAPKGKAVIDLPQGKAMGVLIIPKSLVELRPEGGEVWLDSRMIELLLNPDEGVLRKVPRQG